MTSRVIGETVFVIIGVRRNRMIVYSCYQVTSEIRLLEVCIHHVDFLLWCLSESLPEPNRHLPASFSLFAAVRIEAVRSRKEVSQKVLLVDFPHLIPRHLLHQNQACRNHVWGHVLPRPGLQFR